jgi:hypothetical protein
MAISNTSDFKIYEEQFFGGLTETLQQMTDVMNAASRGAIAMGTSLMKGNYEYESFFKAVSGGLVTRQDITSNSSVTPTKLTQDEFIRVKCHRKIGPTDVTRKAFLMAGENPELASFVFGKQAAEEVAADMLNTALLAARVALANQSAVLNDATSLADTTCTSKNLINTLRKFGDKQNRVVAWIMHSTSWFDLGLDGVDNQVDSIASGIIRVLDVPGMGRPFIVTDSDSLIATADTPDSYYVLGLTAGGIQAMFTEDQYITSQEQLGNEQIETMLQGEYAFNVGLKGFKWDVGNGGANPDSTAIGTGSNWDKAVTADKDLAGVVLKSQARS